MILKKLATLAKWLFILCLPALLITAAIRIEFSSNNSGRVLYRLLAKV